MKRSNILLIGGLALLVSSCQRLPDPGSVIYSKMEKYGDYNKDNVIDSTEKARFMDDFAKDNNLVPVSGKYIEYSTNSLYNGLEKDGSFVVNRNVRMPIYADSQGNEVSLRELEKIAKNYKPKK